MLALAAFGFVLACLAQGPGPLGLGLLLGLIGLVGMVVSIAAGRVSSQRRPDTAMLPPEALAAIRQRAAAQRERADVAAAKGQPRS